MSEKANPHRGEVALELSGKTYKLVPSYENLVKMEDEGRASILDYAQRIHNRTIKINDLAAIVSSTAEPKIDVETAGRALLEEGLVKTIGPISKFFSNALLGGREGNVPPAKED